MKPPVFASQRSHPGRAAARHLVAVVVGSIALLAASPVAADSVASGWGTPSVNGAFAPGEWTSAGAVNFVANTPGGGTTPATLLVMNDASNLYLAVRFARAGVDPGNSLAFEFDKDNNGAVSDGDDAIVYNPDPAVLFRDDVRTSAPPCPGGLCSSYDTDVGGTNDGAGAFANDGSTTVYEMRHPLRSADAAHDIQISAGQAIGLQLSLRLIGAGGGFPQAFGDTTYPSSGFLAVVTAAGPTQVDVPAMGGTGLAILVVLTIAAGLAALPRRA